MDCGNEAPWRVVQPRDLPISPQRSPALLRSRHQLKPSGSFVRDGKSALWGNFANSQQLLAPPHVGGLRLFLRCWGSPGLIPPHPRASQDPMNPLPCEAAWGGGGNGDSR